MLRKKIKELRLKLGWTQEEMAEKLGVTAQVLANMELGRKKIYGEDILKIAKATGVNIDMFLNENLEEFFHNFNSVKRTLTLEENTLIDIYESLTRRTKDFLLDFAHSLKDYESQEVATILPLIQRVPAPYTEIDYYDEAAGMGGGQIVENPVPEKIKIPAMSVPENADFIINAVGDSMEPTFSTGDKLFIQKTNSINIGEIGLFSYQGEQYVKELGNGYLISHNQSYMPIKIANPEELYVQGKVVGKI